MIIPALIASALFLSTVESAGYSISKEYKGSTFFDEWTFDTVDMTHGTVDYGHYTDLAYYDSSKDAAIIKIDNTGGTTSKGRRGIKIKSQATYNQGLFVLDTARIPWGCGVWPAFWTTGSSWPNNGEIDIIEQVHNSHHTGHTLHTSSGCDYSNDYTGGFTGSWSNKNCYWKVNGNSGCGIRAAEGTHGEPWTNGGGGVHVTLWDRNMGIKIWDIPRSSVPSWMTSSTSAITESQLSSLGTPAAYFPFGSHCPNSHFNDNHIIFNIALCGDWPNGVWSSSGCQSSTGKSSCPDYVWGASPSAFNNAYFEVNYLKVFQYSSSVTDGGSTDTGSGTGTDTGSGSSSDCGYYPSTCQSDLNWALSSGIYEHSSYYPNFKDITGTELTSATQDDMVLYWYCTSTNPRGKCDGLQVPCGRSCYGSSTGSSSSCGYVPDSCSGDLNWAAETGTKSYSWWYPNFESYTGVSTSSASKDDVQLYWYCTGENPNGNCDGLEAPCGRSCGSAAFTASDEDGSAGANNWVWAVVGVLLAMSLLLCVILTVYVLRTKKTRKGGDGIQLKDDQQIKGVDDQMIELEESVEKDGDVTTMGLTA